MFLAIVKVENNRITKFQEYQDQQDADAHILRVKDNYPAAFVYDNAAGVALRDLSVNGQTVTVVPFVDRIPTDEERIDRAFPKTDMAHVIFEALFELGNRIQVLEGKPPITRVQLRDWLKAKLEALQ